MCTPFLTFAFNDSASINNISTANQWIVLASHYSSSFNLHPAPCYNNVLGNIFTSSPLSLHHTQLVKPTSFKNETSACSCLFPFSLNAARNTFPGAI